ELRRIFQLDTHVLKAIKLAALPGNVIPVADFPQNRDLFPDNLVAWPLTHADGIKLLLKRSQSQAQQQPIPSHVPQGVEHQREQDRMPVWNQRAEAQLDFCCRGSERRQNHEWVDEGIVRSFHPMRMKYQVVSHPNGIKTHPLGSPGSLNDPVSIGFRAEMGQKQTIFCGQDRKSTRLNSSHVANSYAVLCLKKKYYLVCYESGLSRYKYALVYADG